MSVTYVNRCGVTYHLLVGKTKTGKPKYYVSKKGEGVPAETIPEGFELYERPADGQVHVRRIRHTQLLSCEREQVVLAVRRMTGQEHFFVDVDGDSLIIYWPDVTAEQSSRVLTRLLGIACPSEARMQQWFIEHGRYSPELRFTLKDADERQFTADRMCYRGGIDGWMMLSPPASLEVLLEAFVPHLGQESFFDLI